jgi:geranylgeranyl reductase family protein
MIDTAEVAVLGLGPAGASAAAAAARAGCTVIAVDRRREAGLPVQCAELVPAMIGVEVGDLAAAVRQPIEAMATFVEDEAPDLEPNFPGQVLDRAAFDAALVARAAHAGAQCRFSSAVRRIAPTGILELSNGSEIRARVIIGADGPRSLAGKGIGRVNTELVATRQVTVPLLKAQAATDIFLSAGIAGGYGWLFPRREAANLGAGVQPAAKARLKDIVNRLHSDLARQGRVGETVLATTGGAIPVGGMLCPWGALGDALVLLAGDAAGLANPVTGAGIAAAVLSGRLAGEAASRFAAGASEAALAYEEELEEIFGPALERALRRRRELLAALPGRADLRRAWVAYPDYWR